MFKHRINSAFAVLLLGASLFVLSGGRLASAQSCTPTGLTATPSCQTVALSWTAMSCATSYNVYRSTTSGGEGSTAIKTGITTNSYTDGTVFTGTTYFYKIALVNANGT